MSFTFNRNSIQPRWRNGSVFVLHAKGDSSILSRGTKGDDRQGAEQVCKTSLGRFDSYRPHRIWNNIGPVCHGLYTSNGTQLDLLYSWCVRQSEELEEQVRFLQGPRRGEVWVRIPYCPRYGAVSIIGSNASYGLLAQRQSGCLLGNGSGFRNSHNPQNWLVV